MAKHLFICALLCLAGTLQARDNHTGTWWNPTESGWGLLIFDYGNTLVPVWYTYGADGRAEWYLVSGAEPQPDGSFEGPVVRFTGVPFSQIMGTANDPGNVIGSARLSFREDGRADFGYSIGQIEQTRLIERLDFGIPVNCAFSAAPLSEASNYTAFWWNPTQSGWGVTLTHYGDDIFLAWFTYDSQRRPQWLVASPASLQADGSYSGALYRAGSGVPFDQIDGPVDNALEVVGEVALRFQDGAHAEMTYTLDGISQTRAIERFEPGTQSSICSNVPLGGGGSGPAGEECEPPLKLGNRFLYRTTLDDGSQALNEALVADTGTYEGNPVFIIEHRPIDQGAQALAREFVQQTDDERIYYGSEGYVPEVDAVGTTRNVPPVRIPRRTPPGTVIDLDYETQISYSASGQQINATLQVQQYARMLGYETRTAPVGTFEGACKFEIALDTEITVNTMGLNVRSVGESSGVQWVHPGAGRLRQELERTTTSTVTGAPGPVPPTVIEEILIEDLIEATVDGIDLP